MGNNIDFAGMLIARIAQATTANEPYESLRKDVLAALALATGYQGATGEQLQEAIKLMSKMVTDTNPDLVMETYIKVSEFLNKYDNG